MAVSGWACLARRLSSWPRRRSRGRQPWCWRLAHTQASIDSDNVCSPGGTTICAVEALEKNGFRAAAISAVVAATNKS
ncbi:unnamed protein product, partial [Ectocarpus sp. 12 AP-2014]